MQEWLTGLPFALVVAVITFMLTVLAHIFVNIITDHRRRRVEKRNLLVKIKSTFEFILEFLMNHIGRVEKELEPLIKENRERMTKIEKTDLTVCKTILPKLDILDREIIYSFVKIYHNLKSSNVDIDNMSWFWEHYKNPELRHQIELFEPGRLFKRIRSSAEEYIGGIKLSISQIKELLGKLDKRLDP